MNQPVPMMLDVDTGIDDALALAFALRSPAIEVVAATTLAGNVDVERTTANTLATLDLLEATAVPVHRGASRPLVRTHQNAAYFHDSTGLGDARLPASEREAGPDRGPAAMIRLARARPGELTLVCLGPLTNLAIALNVAPELPGLLRSLVVMGGAFRVGGNVTPRAEFNVFADPEAAAQVFAAEWPAASLIGLDVTQQATMPRRLWERARDAAETDAAAFLVAEVCRRPFAGRELPEMSLHDPLAVAAAVWPELIEWVNGGVEVGTEGEERGATRLVDGGTLRVAQSVDSQRFLAMFAGALGLGTDTESESSLPGAGE